MTIWIVNPFDNLPQEGTRPQRYWLMAREFVRTGHRVVYWTSEFSHATKAKRILRDTAESEIELVLLPTVPYAKNISLRRFSSHRRLAQEFARKARQRLGEDKSAPNLVIASVPPLGLAEAALRVARRCGATFIADVQDAWPETFERILPRPVWSLVGMRGAARRIYCGADGVSAPAKRYLELAKAYGSDAPSHLARHSITMDAAANQCRKRHEGLRLAYIGNMSLSYDLETAIRAVAKTKGVTLDIAGNGPDRARLERLSASMGEGGERIRFHGYLDETSLGKLLRECDAGLIPMFPESCVGMPGKLSDYASAGLRVIECLGGECRELIEGFHAGVHYEAGNVDSLRAAIGNMAATSEDDTIGYDAAAFAAQFDARQVMGEYVRWAEGVTQKRRTRRYVHLLAGQEATSGVANIARRFARLQRERGDEVTMLSPERCWNPVFFGWRFAIRAWRAVRGADEVWVHCSWTFPVWYGAYLSHHFDRHLTVVPEGSFDPKRLHNHAEWKKRLVAPLDRCVLRAADEVLSLCPAERDWIADFEPRARIRSERVPTWPKSETGVTDPTRPLHVLFLGRAEDPLKGVRYLERAVKSFGAKVELRVVSDHVGEDLERDWNWCDVLCLPTLSDNFGLVVAEALEHGRRTIVTDGATAWAEPAKSDRRITYLAGYRDGDDDSRVAMLTAAIGNVIN